MHVSKLPHSVLAKLVALDEEHRALADAAAKRDARIDELRAINNGRIERPDIDIEAVRAELADLLRQQPVEQYQLREHRALVDDVRAWIARLPDGTKLDVVTPATEEQSLQAVRDRIKALQGEISALRSAVVPAADIERRIVAHIARLAAPPDITGVQANEQLQIRWPPYAGAPPHMYTDTPALLPTFALLLKEQLVGVLMAQVTTMANTPLPVAQRAARIEECEAELDALHYEEEALYTDAVEQGEVVERSRAPLQAVLLVRIATDEVPAPPPRVRRVA